MTERVGWSASTTTPVVRSCRARWPSSAKTATRDSRKRSSAQRGEQPSEDQNAAVPRIMACSLETTYPLSARETSAPRTSCAGCVSASAATRSRGERRPSRSGSRSQWIRPRSRVLNDSETRSACPSPTGRNSRCGASTGASTRPRSAAVSFLRMPRGASSSGGVSPAVCVAEPAASGLRDRPRPGRRRSDTEAIRGHAGGIRGAGYANGATPSAAAASFNRRSRLASGQPSRLARAK